MSNRIIKCSVEDEIIKGAGQVVGAAGSHNDVTLELAFSPLWEGTSKRIVWFDALGENPTLTVLTIDMLVPGEGEAYQVPVPPEAKAVEGNIMMTIRGAEVKDGVETRAVVAATAIFRVLPAVWDPFADESMDVTPSQADQIQAQIDEIKEKIGRAVEAADAKEDAQAARTAAEKAQAGAQAAQTAAETAQENAGNFSKMSESWAVGGTGIREGEDANNAKYWADKAQAEADRASVPAVAGVYNVVLTDRVTGDKYALIVENGRLELLGVSAALDTAEVVLVDNTTGTAYAVVIDSGRLAIEEV